MNTSKTIRFVAAFVLSICVAAGLNSLTWPQAVMWRAFVLYLIGALIFGIWIGLPTYSFLRSRYKDSVLNVVVLVAALYGVAYFLVRIFLGSSTSIESIDNIAVVKNGLPTLHGLSLIFLATGEVVAIGCAANLIFWLIFARPFRKSRSAS
jgi:hypothetical protein